MSLFRIMKKFVFFILIIFIFTPKIYASDTEDEILSSVRDELSEFNASLPEYVKDILPKELFNGDFSSLSNGEINHMTFIDSTVNSLLAGLPSALNSVSLILITVIISSVFHTMSSGLESAALKDSYALCSSLCISLAVFGLVGGLCKSTLSYMRTLCTAMNGFAPIMAVMHIMSGRLTTAALGNGSMMMFIALVENILISLLVPIVNICLAISMVRAISGDNDIGGIGRLIKNTFVTLTVFTMMIFSFVFSFQNTLTQSADSLSMKTAKFALGSFIPIVGGSVSEALSTVTASVQLIKSSVGIIGLISVLLLTIPIIVSVYVHKLLLDITASLAGIIGCEREKGIIADASGICGFMLALSSVTAVFFIFSVTIFIKSSVGA